MAGEIELFIDKTPFILKFEADNFILPNGFDDIIKIDPVNASPDEIFKAEQRLGLAIFSEPIDSTGKTLAELLLGDSIKIKNKGRTVETLRYENNGSPTIIYGRRDEKGNSEVMRMNERTGVPLRIAERVVHLLHYQIGDAPIRIGEYPEDKLVERSEACIQALNNLNTRYPQLFNPNPVTVHIPASAAKNDGDNALPISWNVDFKKDKYSPIYPGYRVTITVDPSSLPDGVSALNLPEIKIYWNEQCCLYTHGRQHDSTRKFFLERHTMKPVCEEALIALEDLILEIYKVAMLYEEGESNL